MCSFPEIKGNMLFSFSEALWCYCQAEFHQSDMTTMMFEKSSFKITCNHGHAENLSGKSVP